MVIFKAIPYNIGKELDVESYMVGKVFESSFQNIKQIENLSFAEGVMVILVKRCQSTKLGHSVYQIGA